MKGIIRQPGLLVVQIPQKRTKFSIPGWYNHDNALLCFIDAIYVCRSASDDVDYNAFSVVIGGQEQRLSIHLHATLIAALAVVSIIGGQNVNHIVEAILNARPDPGRPLPLSSEEDWQVRSRIRCPCEHKFTHGALTPVAAAKSIGIAVWREREAGHTTRVWDLNKNQLVKNVDVRKVIFITHKWIETEKETEVLYEEVANATVVGTRGISAMSDKLKRIRDALVHHTDYVWLDTICIDKSNLSELDEVIRSMYTGYANCQAVVMDSGTTLDVWRGRGWFLQEGAAAGQLCGISHGKLVSIQSVAKTEQVDLCKLDLSLYYLKVMLWRYSLECMCEKPNVKRIWHTL